MALRVGKLLSAITSVSTGHAAGPSDGKSKTIQCTVAGSGAVTATVDVLISNDQVVWLTLATFILSGTTSASDGLVSTAPWAYYKGDVTALTGTSAAVTLTIAEVTHGS